jgi:hypothetical protein
VWNEQHISKSTANANANVSTEARWFNGMARAETLQVDTHLQERRWSADSRRWCIRPQLMYFGSPNSQYRRDTSAASQHRHRNDDGSY